jgi:hypothetical protein
VAVWTTGGKKAKKKERGNKSASIHDYIGKYEPCKTPCIPWRAREGESFGGGV